MKYSIFNPTGNITALVESPVEVLRQPEAAAQIMQRHPEVEQVGFICESGAAVQPSLRMAGGEFCGNASMSAAALLEIKHGQEKRDGKGIFTLQVSGAEKPVQLKLMRKGPTKFDAAILMPEAESVESNLYEFEKRKGKLPLVQMQGISHLILEEESEFFEMLYRRGDAERAVQSFCRELDLDCLGMMFLKGEGRERTMTPLVYVPGSATMFWENSCASGSAAVGMYLAKKSGRNIDLTLREPGGTLRVNSNPDEGITWLYGSTELVAEYDTQA